MLEIAAATFTSNIYFYSTSNYFSAAATSIPLLHYWSLGVEEQFYILFPLLIWAGCHLKPKAIPFLILMLLATSLISYEAVMRTNATAAFYLLPFRAFELLVGCALALKQVRFSSDRRVGWTSVSVGIVLVVAAMLLLDEAMQSSGIAALIPCIGTALVIWGAERVKTFPTRLLGSPPFVWIGSISYSLYYGLCHSIL
jgi:peptidoglycan/LPS O-acetylase OafA/YrhL